MDLQDNLAIFNSNLKYILKKNDMSQRELSIKTGTSCATINNLINKKSEPSLSFLLKLKEQFGINIDSFVNTDISKAIETRPEMYKSSISKFLGSYIMYFYNSGEYKGKLSSYSKNTLKYAVLSLIQHESSEQVTAIASFIRNRDDAEEIKDKLDRATSADEKERIHKSLDQLYYGNLEVSDTQAFLYLKSDVLNDQSLMIFNNPPSTKPYLGGLGTANSVSRGREHMPCVQFVLLSRKILKISDGEIYNLLALGVSDINVEIEAEQLINLFKNLYINNANLKDDLSAIQKRKIVENSLNNLVADLIDANMFRFAKVSNMEDDDYYRIIKDE